MDDIKIKEAKEKVYQSPIVKYVPKEKIEEAFSRIHVYENQEEWEEVSKNTSWQGGNENLEGFNRKDGRFFGPKTTLHTIVHEVLHELSSEFDKEGHLKINGIQGNDGEYFSNQVNEGLTDYLAAKISGELPRYVTECRFFEKLAPVIEQWYQDDEILYKIYLNHDTLEFKSFLDIALKQYGGAKEIYEKISFFGDKEFLKIEKIANKNLKRHLKKQNSFFRRMVQKVKENFGKKEVLAIPETTTESRNYTRKKHQEFCKQYEEEINHDLIATSPHDQVIIDKENDVTRL